MKKIIKNLVYGLAVVAGAVMASCSTTDEIMDSIPYNRVLTPQKFDATVVRTSGTDVTFSWTPITNAESYILEVFDAIEIPGEEEGSKTTYSVSEADYEGIEPIYVNDEITSSDIPVTISFDVDKTYFARVRGVSSKVESSIWVYLEKVFSTYPVRPSLNPVVVTRTTSEISIAWDDAEDKADLTTFEIVPVSAEELEPTVIDVTSADIEACAKSFSGLDSGTEYKITLIYGKGGERGSVAAWTRPDMGQVVKVNTVQDIYNNINEAAGEVRLEVAYNNGEEYNFAEVLTDPETGGMKALTVGCDLYLFGETTDDGKKPVLSRIEFALNGTSKVLHVEDVILDGKKTIGATASVAADSNLELVEFINCEMFDYTKGIYSVSDKVTANAEKVLFKGVYAHDINADGSVAGDFIDIRGGNNPDVELLNSTFSFCARTFLRISDNAKGSKVTVNNCTFNSVTATISNSNNAGVFHLRETTEISEVYMNNCLFLNMVSDNDNGKGKDGWIRLARNNATQNFAPACVNNYFYNVSEEFFTTQAFVPQTGEHIAPSNDIIAPPANWTAIEEDPCVKSEIGKLYLSNGEIAANRVGDPRWWSATEPIIIRATELETVTATTEWDFTAKAKFETETVSENTIIENIRIYAPAEIVSGTGIQFAAASTVSAVGRPSASALGFKAEGYGSVTVLTEDGGFNASVHVVAGQDRITLPADGKAHKAVFGDLVGENEIFVLAGSPVTIVSVTWTAEDYEAEETKTTLATPKVSLAPANVTEGNEDMVDVVASWAAVENAADYVVIFNNQTFETAETLYTFAAADIAALSVGDYEISVVARPVATSSKYAESEAGVAKFTVKEKPAAGAPVTLVWDFSTAEWQAAFEAQAPAAKGSNADAWSVTLDGFTYTSGSGNGKWDASGFIQPNGGGNADDSKLSRIFSFNAPANGTLKVTAQTASSGNPRAVNVKDAKDTQTQNVDAREELSFDVVAGEVRIYPGGGIRFYKFEFTYIDPDAVAAEPVVWNFAEVSWLEDFMDTIKTTNDRNFNYDTGEGLFIVNEGSGGIKNNTAGSGYIDTNGNATKGPKQLRFEFEVPAGKWNVSVLARQGEKDFDPHTLKLGIGSYSADNAGNELDADVAATHDGEADWASFETINVSATSKVYIYASGRTEFYGLKYEPAE